MDFKLTLKSQPRLKHVELLLFTKYLSVLLRSGLPLDESLDILNKQSKKKKSALGEILTSLTNFIRTGKTLADGLVLYPKTFTPVYLNMIRAGEASGTLQDNLDQLVKQLEKEHELTQKIRGAMMYPAVIFTAGLGIAIFIVVFILPQITGLFASLKVELPFTTRAIFWLSNFIRFQWSWLLIIIFLVTVGFNITYRLKVLKPFFHGFFLWLPITGKLTKEVNLARSFRLMGTLLKSGLPISEVLETALKVLRNIRYINMFTAVKDGVARGNTATSVLENYPNLISPLAMRLILVGEETGTLGEMLMYLAEFYEEEIEDETKNLTSLLEPVLIVVIGFVIGWLAVSILSPIYKVVGSV
ncbi:MAG: type II secretion system F family protein [Candidatus Uhrbacteria bacterium]